MNKSIILRVVLLGAIAIVSITALQIYWLAKNWSEKSQEFDEKVNIALRNVVQEFKKVTTLPSYEVIKQVSSNYYVVNINQVINANDLEHYLKTNLEKVGLNEVCQYAIYDCNSNKMVGGNLLNLDKTDNLKKEELPTYDKYTYYFGIRFPEKQENVLYMMLPSLIVSGILFVTVLFFTYSIFVILRQKQLSEMQKDFINNMTHEFKTPISTIKISADVFNNDALVLNNERLKRYATIIAEQNQRLNNQVEKVLQIAKIEREEFRLNKESLHLHQLIEECLLGIRLNIENSNGKLTLDLKAENDLIVADRLHLTNVIHNLLDNAIKYCKTTPIVTITTQNSNDKLRLSIKDEGIGIAKEHQDKIFQKFYRVPTGNVHNVKGFGLGLFYVQSICNAHRWKIALDSVFHQETTVTISMNYT